MRVLAIQSSANEDGLTARLAQAALDGAGESGAGTELVHLNSLDILPCRACGTGWGHHHDSTADIPADSCVIEDDFTWLRQKVVEADALVFCTPVYFWDLSESAKVFLDRLRRTHYPVRDQSPFLRKPVVAVAAAGGSGNGAAEAAAILDSHLIRWMGMKRILVLAVTRQTAELHEKTARRAGEMLVDKIRSG